MGNEHLVLLVEDDPVYAEQVVGAVQGMDLDVGVLVLGDGQAALEFLQGTVGDPQQPRPDLVLLDLRLPKVDGLDVLGQMKETKGLRRIPVVAMTTSGSEEDVEKAYDLGVNGYLAKPVGKTNVQRMIQGLLRYWLTCNRTAQVA